MVGSFSGVAVDFATFVGLCCLGATEVGHFQLTALVNGVLFLSTARGQLLGGALIFNPRLLTHGVRAADGGA
jgi:hypothetical protein